MSWAWVSGSVSRSTVAPAAAQTSTSCLVPMVESPGHRARRAGRGACGTECGCGCSAMPHFDDVRGVQINLEVGGTQLGGLWLRSQRLPILWVREEELHHLGIALRSQTNRIVVADVGPDTHIHSLDGSSETG